MNETVNDGWSVLVGASNEEDLITKSRFGDTTSFVGLVQTHDAYLRRVAFSLLGTVHAMDVVLQQCYLNAFDAMRNSEDDAPFSNWLFRRVVVACDAVRADLDSSSDDETQKLFDIMPTEEVAAVSMIGGEAVSIDRAAELFNVTDDDMQAIVASGRAVLGGDDTEADERVVAYSIPRHDQGFWTTVNRLLKPEAAHDQSEAVEQTNTARAPEGARRWLGRSATALTVSAASLLVVVAATVTMLGKA